MHGSRHHHARTSPTSRPQRCNKELAALSPDVYVKGGDYTVEKLDPTEREVLFSCGAEFQFIPFVPGYSTTAVIKLSEGGK